MPGSRIWGAGRWVVGGCLLLAGICNRQTLTWMGRFLTLSQPPQPADLILVLGGNFWGPRALKGADLGAQGYARKVMISGPPYLDQPESELSIRFLVEKGYNRELFISFPNHTKSTIDESLAVCPELLRLGARSVLIVTSDYHSRRSNIVFRLFCPGLRYSSIAAPDSSQFDPENWWKNERYRKTFFAEWEKILGTFLWEYPRHRVKRLWNRQARAPS